jgi:thiamine kinase-like enzyme
MDKLRWWTKLRIALTLRDYVLQMQSLSDPRPGPPGGNVAQLCKGVYFGEGLVGPFQTYADLTAWYNHKQSAARGHPRSKIPENAAPFDDSMPLVFVHQDLNMDNLLLGDDGKLWVLDWSDAGFYPKWFEYANMDRMADSQHREWRHHSVHGWAIRRRWPCTFPTLDRICSLLQHVNKGSL